MAPRLRMSEVWWARELGRARNAMTIDTLRLFSDDAIDEMHSIAGSIYNMLTTEYRKRMGVVVDDVSEL